MSIRVFLSHSSEDVDLAKSLIDFLRRAIPIPDDEIRCTSVPGYRLPTGVEADKQLLDELLGASVFIALLTPASLTSKYVLFEMGARWGAKTKIFPILTHGIRSNSLSGPLTAINARKTDSTAELHQLVCDVAAELRLRPQNAGLYQSEMEHFLNEALRSDAETPPQKKGVAIRHGAQKASVPLTVSPRELCQTLRDAPPLKVADIAEQYLGFSVDWETLFSSGNRNGSEIVLCLKPWEPDGADTPIRCRTTVEKNPELQHATKEAPIRVRGRIASLGPWDIELEDAVIALMTTEEAKGTRIPFLVQAIRRKLGATSKGVSTELICEAIKSQIEMGKPSGLRIVNERVILPELGEGSDIFKLLVLNATKHVIQSDTDISTAMRRDRVGDLETEIYYIENGAGCSSF